MAYTHYWTYFPATPDYRAAWPHLVADTRRIVEAATHLGITLAGPFGHDEPTIDEITGIRLNGAGDTGCEAFSLIGPGPTVAERVDDFCKTARKPYDLVVACVLLRAHQLMPKALAIASDGDWDNEWFHGAVGGGRPGSGLGARRLLTNLFGPQSDICPFGRPR